MVVIQAILVAFLKIKFKKELSMLHGSRVHEQSPGFRLCISAKK